MENHKNQEQLDAFTRKIIKEIPLEGPSKDFTKNIMSAVAKKQSIHTKFVPLISWKTWGIAAVFILGLFFLPSQKSEDSMLDKIPFEFSFSDLFDKIPSIEGVTFSNLTVYAFLLFAIMMSIQIFYLKGFFEKRFNE